MAALSSGCKTCIFSIVAFCLCFSCVVRVRKKIFFIRTNLVSENKSRMKLTLTVYNHFMLGVSCIHPSIPLIHLAQGFLFQYTTPFECK